MVNNNFNAVEILNNIEGVTVIKDIRSIPVQDIVPNCTENLTFGFLPYCNYKQILEYPETDYLFAHQDIQGSKIRGDFALPEGITEENLNKYKLVFNGHIHKCSILRNVVNVGSVVTHSFADDEETIPQAYIFDTTTFNIKSFKNYNCPLFRKVHINTMEDLAKYIHHIDKAFEYVLNVYCPYDIKDSVKEYLQNIKDLIINNKVNVKIDRTNTIKENSLDSLNNVVELQANNVDMEKLFLEFLETIDLKYPLDVYKTVLTNKV